ncbi:1-phosphofructokinase [Ligilactobacillus pobuzihii E100301 = KCTC 13174]|uniref:Tagatose-6-phosphate kinase n=2 Tax=Ligilactobacillus pobuzihii TaxID=449659 RepID=A0A0R2LMZ6_9LACO|nr:1-phosphofructokinase [Ligilactobacillus pobuzihii E100301 = KCTC 13174]KRO01644.1 1-phosphofructokinase [Ligilactobacillus pobuzihii]
MKMEGESMIYTLTLNPAIDLFIETNELKKNSVNRTKKYDIQANGKGINVSFILKRLGISNTATGVGGGFTLNYIQQELANNNIENFFINTDGITRINVFTHVNSQDCEYKLVNPGPKVTQESQVKLLQYFDRLKTGDIVSLSGSFSSGINPNIITKLAKIIKQKEADFIIDTSYSEVLDVLKYHPLLIKPNQEEIKKWFNIDKEFSIKETITLAQRLIKAGAQNVLLSLGENGAAFISKDSVYYGNAPKITALNSAGAGDTMLGTFIAGMVNQLDAKSNLQKSIAAGSDTTQSMWITDFKNVDLLEKQVKVERLTDI